VVAEEYPTCGWPGALIFGPQGTGGLFVSSGHMVDIGSRDRLTKAKDESTMQQLDFQHRHKSFSIRITEDGTLELYLDGCLRKSRPRSNREPQYVWTNVELEWEEHHYIEARLWASSGRLRVTINGAEIFDGAPTGEDAAAGRLLPTGGS
jgi:hypothetical protein